MIKSGDTAIPSATTSPRFRRTARVRATRAEHHGSKRTSEDRLRYDSIVLRLLCAWIFFQCFYYNAIPWLRWNLGLTVTPDRLVLVAMLLVAAGSFTGSRDMPSTQAARVVGRAAALFAFVALTSWFVNGSDSGSARFGALTWLVNLSVFPALTFFVAARLQYSRVMLKELLTFLVAFGVYLGVTAVAEHFNATVLVFPKYILDSAVGIHFGRSRGPFADAISNGGMLLLSLLASIFFSASTTGLKRVVTSCLTLLMVVAVYFTETRAVWLALATVVATMLILDTHLRRFSVAIVGVLVVAFLIGIGSKFSMSEGTLFSRRQQSIDYRLDNYQIAWDAFKANPVFGVGYGKLWVRWHEFFDRKNSRLSEGMDEGNHNTVLGLLAELGLTGTIPYIGMVIAASFLCFTAYRAMDDPQTAFERQFAVLAIGALEILVVLGLTNDLKAMPTVNVTAFLFLGALASLASTQRSTTVAQEGNRQTIVSSRGRRSKMTRPQCV